MTSPQATSLMSTVLSSLWPQAKQKAPTGPAADDGVCRHRGGDKVGCEVWPPEDAPAAAPATPPAALVGGIGGMADPLSISQLTVDFWLSRATPDGMLTQKRTRAQLKQHAAQGEVEETLLEMTEPAYLLGRLQQVWCRMEQDPTLFGLTAESIETFKAEAGDGLRHIHVRFEQETERPDAPRDCFAREARISGASPPPLELRTCTYAPQTCTACTHKASCTHKALATDTLPLVGSDPKPFGMMVLIYFVQNDPQCFTRTAIEHEFTHAMRCSVYRASQRQVERQRQAESLQPALQRTPPRVSAAGRICPWTYDPVCRSSISQALFDKGLWGRMACGDDQPQFDSGYIMEQVWHNGILSMFNPAARAFPVGDESAPGEDFSLALVQYVSPSPRGDGTMDYIGFLASDTSNPPRLLRWNAPDRSRRGRSHKRGHTYSNRQ